MGIAYCDSYKVVGTPKSNLFLLWWASLIWPSSIFVKLCEQFSIEAPHFSPFIKVVYMQAELYPNNLDKWRCLWKPRTQREWGKKAYIQLSQLWFTSVNCLHQSVTIYLTELTTFTLIVGFVAAASQKRRNQIILTCTPLPLPKKKKLLALQLHVQQSDWLLEISILHTIYDHFWPGLLTMSWEYGCIHCD
jgi:hypothetical protein